MGLPERETIEYYVRIGVAAATALLMFYSAASVANTEQDYSAGLRAYQTGDVVGAMNPLRRAALAGHAPAQALLADILDQAGFVDEAVGFYRKAAEQGNAEGEFGLGTLYSAGRGVERDPPSARKWIERAAEGGHVRAINMLAQSYMTGGLGLDKAALAGPSGLAWIRKAAARDYLPAIDFLAKSFRTGAHGETDLKQAESLEARARELRKVSGAPAKARK